MIIQDDLKEFFRFLNENNVEYVIDHLAKFILLVNYPPRLNSISISFSVDGKHGGQVTIGDQKE
jgi:hypothetical protein